MLGVPQGSILDPLLFNIILNDIVLFINNLYLCNYGYENTLYTTIFLVELDLQSNFSISREWFYEYHIILNHGKCHYMPLVGHTKIE